MFVRQVIILNVFLVWMTECSCPDGFKKVYDSCFFFNTGYPSLRSDWDTARSFCVSKGADLAVIKDCRQFKELVNFINFNSIGVPHNAGYWIGATDRKKEGKWTWVDDTLVDLGPPFWGSLNGNPEPSGGKTQNCADMYRNDRYYFHDAECNRTAFALCQTPPTEKPAFTIS